MFKVIVNNLFLFLQILLFFTTFITYFDKNKSQMIGIEKFHRDVRALLKQNKSGFVSPPDIDSFIYMATMDILEESILRYKANGQNFSEDNDLIKFHSFSGAGTERVLPTDVHTVVGVFNGTTEGDLLDLSTYQDRLNSVILPPSATRPIATTYGANILIEPSSTTHKIKYFRIPTTCLFNYTLTNNTPVFNSVGSVAIDLPLSLYADLLKKVLVYAVPITNNVYAGQLAQQ